MYKTVNVTEYTKEQLTDLKKSLALKNESEVLNYLLALYERTYPDLRLNDHVNYLMEAQKRSKLI